MCLTGLDQIEFVSESMNSLRDKGNQAIVKGLGTSSRPVW